MRKHVFFKLAILVTMIAACSGTEKKQDIDNAQIVSNTNSPDSTVINFLKWYRDNEERLSKIQLIKGGWPDTTTFYSVDFNQTEKYLLELSKSNFLSEKFISDLRDYFKTSNEYLIQHHENDGPPSGFDADLIMKSQDYDDVWTNIDKAKELSKDISSNKANLKFQFAGNYKMEFSLSKTGNKWLIDLLD